MEYIHEFNRRTFGGLLLCTYVVKAIPWVYCKYYVSRYLHRGIVMEQCANIFMCVNAYLLQQFPIRNPLITAVASFLKNIYD